MTSAGHRGLLDARTIDMTEDWAACLAGETREQHAALIRG